MLNRSAIYHEHFIYIFLTKRNLYRYIPEDFGSRKTNPGFKFQSYNYCICGYFSGGFIFANFASQTLRKFPLQFMSIYSNDENIRKITKLTPRKFLHLVQNQENICTRKLRLIQYSEHLGLFSIEQISNVTFFDLHVTRVDCDKNVAWLFSM